MTDINEKIAELEELLAKAEAALEDIPIMRQAVKRSRAKEKHWKERFLEQKKLAEAHHKFTIQVKAERDWLADQLGDFTIPKKEYWLEWATKGTTKNKEEV